MARNGGKSAPIVMRAQAPIDRRPSATVPGGPAPAARQWFKIYSLADPKASSTRVDIYEEIGGWGVSAAEFVQELRAVATPQIDLHINSPGGSVFDGVAIYNALVQHPAQVHGYVDGLAASAASFIAQACDSITMNPGSMMMVHDAIGMTWGNALDHTTMAGLLAQVSDSIADLYAARAGGEPAEWRAVMENNGGEGRWYTAREAVDAGLADKVAGDPEPEDSPGEPTQDATAPVSDDPRDAFDRSSIAAGHRLVAHYAEQVLATAPPPRETLADLVQREFAAGIKAFEDQWVADNIVGNGTGKPRGFLNGAATVEPSNSTPLADITAAWKATGGDAPLVNW